jgi:predicted acyltransferase
MPTRVLAIDALRGLTIAFMILVNDAGDWNHVYRQLDHSPWNGFTLTDLVFPTFLFLVGASLILSLHARLARGASRRTLALHILRRAAILFVLDLFIAAYPHYLLSHLRLYGVLTRIALCYLLAGLILLITQRPALLAAITATLLITYWALMRFVPIPGLGIPTHQVPLLDPDNNLTAYIDRAITAFLQHTIHTGALYEQTRDPEGLLSTLPALATTLLGSLTALWLRRPQPVLRTLLGLILAAVIATAAGLAWNPWFPINKKLWTSSYVLFAAGLALLLLALFYWLIDILHIDRNSAGKALLYPFLVFGSNAIAAYALAELLVETLFWIRLPSPAAPGHPQTAWFWIYHNLFARQTSTELTSLTFAIAYVLFCFLIIWLLHRKQIFIKI